MNRGTLSVLLSGFGVPINEWGTGKAKTIENLFEELQLGEARLIVGQKLQRHIRAVGVTVLGVSPAIGLLFLKEHQQVFLDGRERERDLETSLGEKILPGETPMQAAHRALAEELRLEYGFLLIPGATQYKTEFSASYPGLETVYEILTFSTTIPPYFFNPEGYMVNEGDKTSYYVWTKKAPKFFRAE